MNNLVNPEPPHLAGANPCESAPLSGIASAVGVAPLFDATTGPDGAPAPNAAVASYPEALEHMKRHLGRLAARYRVDVADVRQTLYVVWNRVAQHRGHRHIESRDVFYKYLYRALQNELSDTAGLSLQCPAGEASGEAAAAAADTETTLLADVETAGDVAIPPVDDQIRALIARSSTEAAFPEAVRTHPLYAHPSCRVVLEGVLEQEPVEKIAARLGVTRRRVHAQIEELQALFQRPDAAQVDRIFRAIPEHQWLPGAPLTRRTLESLRYPPPDARSEGRIAKALHRFMRLGVQPAVVYVDQFSRVLSGVEVCRAARLLGVGAVATLLQVSRSASPDLTDEGYLRACEENETDADPCFELIPAFRKLFEDGYLSGIVAAFLHELGKTAQYTLLRELGTGLAPLLGARECRTLLKALRDRTFADEIHKQRARMLSKVRADPQGGA